MSLGERTKQRRQALKITQQQLAQSVGMTPQHISAIEQGKWTPSLTLLPQLAEELGVSIDFHNSLHRHANLFEPQSLFL
jgi:transcriptional regulator with XRE-family HTH domain